MNLIAAALTLLIVGADPGTAVFPLLKIGQGCRAAAMGESFAGLANDASAVYWNPAGLGIVAGRQFDLSHQEWFGDIRDEVGHAALPLGPGALGLGLVYSGEPDVRYWDATQLKFATFNAWSTILSAGYGWRLSDKYTIGATATGLYEDLKLEHGLGATVDVGATGHPTDKLGIGFAARHLGYMSYGAGSERLPMEFALGAAYSIKMFNFTLDAVAPALDNAPNVRAGIEFMPIKQLAIRAGYRTGPVSLSSLGYANGLTGGIGVTVGNFGIDYAIVPYGELGLTHRIGLRLEAPPPSTGVLSMVVLDAESGHRLAANLAVTGIFDTTATTAEFTAAQVKPGDATVRAALDAYEPASKTVTVVAGRRTEDTLLLKLVTAELTGGIYDARTKKPIGGKVVRTGPSAGETTVPGTPGTFDVTGLKPGDYSLSASGPTDEYLPQSAKVTLAPNQTARNDFYLWKKGDLMYLMVNFETGKADILPQFYPEIDSVGRIIQQTPSIRKIELSGNTDPRAIKTKEFPSNWELSQARAEAIRQYLIKKFGIAPERLVAKGYADTKPIAPNTSPEGMYKNRRTELRIVE